MAVRTYRDAKGRTRYLVEFQQRGTRVVRRLYPGANRSDAVQLETKLRGEVFTRADLGQTPEISLAEALDRWVRDRAVHLKDGRKAGQNALLLMPFVRDLSLRQAPEAAQMAIRAWSARTGAGHARHRAKAGQILTASDSLPSSMADPRGTVHARRLPATTPKAATKSGNAGTLSPATINRRLCVLKAAAKYAWKQGWIDENVSGRISLLREDNKREIYLTAAQVRSLALSAPTKQCQSAIFIAAYSGLRASELLALPAMHSRSDTLRVLHSKTGKPRSVPVSSVLRPYLSALPLGLSYDQLRKQFLVARAKAKMPHVRWHDLRHTTASLLVNAGVDLYVIGAILGHSSTQTTARYAHLADATKRQAMEKLR